MLGYWNDPHGTDRVLRPEGLRTGDLAYADEEGFLYIVGRRGDMIKSGPYRISPHEIEDLILRQPQVAEVAVLGHPDNLWGEVPVAYVVPQSGHAVDVEPLLEACRKHLPRYKQPDRIEIVDSVPQGTNGKTRRAALREIVTVDKHRVSS
jgi:acyl-CoA synthetase (AMP-forming)/AMP-acid ligase II